MIIFRCDRCGKLMRDGVLSMFTIDITPPEIRLLKHPAGHMHLCEECMDKIMECIQELGRSE